MTLVFTETEALYVRCHQRHNCLASKCGSSLPLSSSSFSPSLPGSFFAHLPQSPYLDSCYLFLPIPIVFFLFFSSLFLPLSIPPSDCSWCQVSLPTQVNTHTHAHTIHVRRPCVLTLRPPQQSIFERAATTS